MMKAKDTVMGRAEIERLFGVLPTHFQPASQIAEDVMVETGRIYAQAQAEISFPLGKQEGRREVVELAKELLLPFVYDGSPTRLDWQAKLKEWRISEPEIDETQELADLRHNASDDTIG